jgi:hypothetical protein
MKYVVRTTGAMDRPEVDFESVHNNEAFASFCHHASMALQHGEFDYVEMVAVNSSGGEQRIAHYGLEE